MISSTLVLVFFTTIVFGALMPIVVKYLNGNNNSDATLENIDLHSINDPELVLETFEFQRYEKIDSQRFYYKFKLMF